MKFREGLLSMFPSGHEPEEQVRDKAQSLQNLFFIVIFNTGRVIGMDYEWDEAKNASNKIKHRIGFEEIHDFDWNMAVGLETQSNAGELRDLWVGPIGDKLCTLVITDRRQVVRIISLREADNGEIREWQNEFQR